MLDFQPGLVVSGDWSMNNSGDKQRLTHSGRQYEQQVIGLLREVNSHPAGRVLLHLIRRQNGRELKIIPFSTQGLPPGQINAITAARDPIKATPKGKVVLDADGNPAQFPGAPVDPVTGQFGWTLGTGTGSSIVIAFTPGLFTHNWRLLSGFRPDEVLFHEMTHALRDMEGHMHTERMRFVAGHQLVGEYNNREEFLATLTSNIYISSKRAGRPIRASYVHKRNVPDTAARTQQGGLRTGYSPSESFLLENLGLVAQMYREEQTLARGLAAIECTFNPFRDYEAMNGGPRH